MRAAAKCSHHDPILIFVYLDVYIDDIVIRAVYINLCMHASKYMYVTYTCMYIHTYIHTFVRRFHRYEYRYKYGR